MNEGESPANESVLIPVIARLKEIERKCETMGARNEDFPRMKEKLASIIARLQAGEEPSGDPLGFAAMARELFPVSHLFESLGFMSVGKEISHIERTLQELEPKTDPESSSVPVQSPRPQMSAARTTDPGEIELNRNGPDDENEDPSRPWPVFVGFAVLLAAIVVASLVVFRVGPFAPAKPVSTPAPTPLPSASPIPTPGPGPSPTLQHDSGENPKAVLAESVAEARLALQRGDLEGAVRQLSNAALIDRNEPALVEIAEQLVTIFVNDANGAAHEQRWEDAEALLERARRTALRFGLPIAPIDRAARQHETIVRYQIVGPNETSAIRAGIGRRVEVRMKERFTRDGRIGGVEGGNFLLQVEDDVGGGVVRYIDELPLSTIQAIKIYED